MYVLIVARGVPGPSDPLRGVFELDQAKALQDAGHRVVIAALDARSVRRRRPMGMHLSTVDGVDVVRLDVPLGRVPVGIDHAVHARAMTRLWRAVVDRYGTPEVVHAHFSHYAAALVRSGVLSAGSRRIPMVVTEHDSHLRPGHIDRLRDENCRVGLAGADRVLAVSGALARILVERYGVDVAVVPDVVDVELFDRPAHPRPGINLLSVGNLIERKGMADLCRAVLRVAEGEPGLSLRIAGHGPARPELERLLAAEDPRGRVTLLGALDREQVAEEMAGADGFALFSRWETFGVVYAEAMAAGLPVLATPCGGPEGFLGPGTAVVARGFADQDLTAAVADFVDRLASFDRGLIRTTARRKFAPAALARDLTEVYQGLS